MGVAYRTGWVIPVDSDTPDVPRDIKNFADSQWQNVGGVANQIWDQVLITAGSGSQELVGVNHPWPAGTLLNIHTSFFSGVLNAVIGYHWIEGDGGIISPQFGFTGQPTGVSFTNHCLRVVVNGPGHIGLRCRMDVSNIAAAYRYINIQAMTRGF